MGHTNDIVTRFIRKLLDFACILVYYTFNTMQVDRQDTTMFFGVYSIWADNNAYMGTVVLNGVDYNKLVYLVKQSPYGNTWQEALYWEGSFPSVSRAKTWARIVDLLWPYWEAQDRAAKNYDANIDEVYRELHMLAL